MAVAVGWIVGSLSAQSINRKLVETLIDLESERDPGLDEALEFTEIPIADLPLYNYDLDGAFPAEATRFKDAIRASDALLIATPEYNRSIPGALKNAIDWGSRPYGDSAFGGKPVGIVGTSPGAPGTSMAQQHLRNILAYLDAPTLGQPEVFLQHDDEIFADPSAREFLGDWLNAFREWITHFR